MKIQHMVLEEKIFQEIPKYFYYQNLGVVYSVAPCEPRGTNLVLMMKHPEMMLCTNYQSSKSVCLWENAF